MQAEPLAAPRTTAQQVDASHDVTALSVPLTLVTVAAPLLMVAFAGAASAQQRPGCPTFSAQNFDRGTDPRAGSRSAAAAGVPGCRRAS